jgi:hypothetical protein
MQGSLSQEADFAPCPRRQGRVADYYQPIARAVKELDDNTEEARGALYDRVRIAVASQLGRLTPAFSDSDIILEQLAVERAIRKLENDSRHRSLLTQPSLHKIQPLLTIPGTDDKQSEVSNVAGSSTPPDADGKHQTANDLAFAKKLAMDKPDLSAELRILQNEIWHRDTSSMEFPARRLVPLTITGLLVLSLAASGAY